MTPGRLVSGALFIGVVIVAVIYWVRPQPSGVWFGIAIFVFGWIITAALSVKDRIKQHTFDLILRTRFEDVYRKSDHTLHKALKDIGTVDLAEAHRIFTSQKDDDIELRRSMSALLNFYEILALSVYYKDADERIIKEYFYDVITRIYKQLENFMPSWREHYPEAFVYLEWLYKKWTK